MRLARLESFEISLGPAVVDPEVVRLKVAPAAPVARLRLHLRGAIADVWGASRVPDDEGDFAPHVSLAYSNREGDLQPILDAAAAARYRPLSACGTQT